MKGLEQIPTEEQLSRVYHQLQSLKVAATSEEIALWTQWARFDPRLAEQLVQHFSLYWREISPVMLNDSVLKQPWPAIVGVLLDQASVFGGLPTVELKLFRSWSACVMSGVDPALNEQFFMGLRSFAGKAMLDDAQGAIKSYRRWGFLGREYLANKAVQKLSKQPRTLVPASVRRAKLDELIRLCPRFTARDYRESLGGGVSLRQAELDLRAHPRLRAVGKTRARVYLRKRGRETC